MALPEQRYFTPDTLAARWKQHGVTPIMILGWIAAHTLKAIPPPCLDMGTKKRCIFPDTPGALYGGRPTDPPC